jgi:hypothetical protein
MIAFLSEWWVSLRFTLPYMNLYYQGYDNGFKQEYDIFAERKQETIHYHGNRSFAD